MSCVNVKRFKYRSKITLYKTLNANLRYRNSLLYVLKGINVNIKSPSNT